MLKNNNKSVIKAYNNQNVVKKMYMNNNVVFQYNELPQGYQQCKYIQTTGSQYIATDFIPNNYNGNFTVVMDIQGVEDLDSAAYLCGCGGSNRCCNFRVMNGMNIQIYNNSTAETPSAATVVSLTATEADILNRNIFKIILRDEDVTTLIKDGIEYSRGNISRTNGTSRFVIGRSSGTNYPVKIFDWKFYDVSDNLVRHFIPCLDDNNVPCMYESVNQTTFYNTGTGTFLYELL